MENSTANDQDPLQLGLIPLVSVNFVGRRNIQKHNTARSFTSINGIREGGGNLQPR